MGRSRLHAPAILLTIALAGVLFHAANVESLRLRQSTDTNPSTNGATVDEESVHDSAEESGDMSAPDVVANNMTPVGRSLHNRGDDCFLDSMIFPMFAGTSANDYLIDPLGDQAGGQTSQGKKVRSDLRHVVNEFRSGNKVHVEHLRDDIGIRGPEQIDFANSQQDAGDAWNYLMTDLNIPLDHQLTQEIDSAVATSRENLDNGQAHVLPRGKNFTPHRTPDNTMVVNIGASLEESVINDARSKVVLKISPADLAAIRKRPGQEEALKDVQPKTTRDVYYNHNTKTFQYRDTVTGEALSPWISIHSKDAPMHNSYYERKALETDPEFRKTRDKIDEARKAEEVRKLKKIEAEKLKKIEAEKSTMQKMGDQYTQSGRSLDMNPKSGLKLKTPTAFGKSHKDLMFWGHRMLAAREHLYRVEHYSKNLVSAATQLGVLLYVEDNGGKDIDPSEDNSESVASAEQGIIERSLPILEVAMIDEKNNEGKAIARMNTWTKKLIKARGEGALPIAEVLNADSKRSFEDRAAAAEKLRPDLSFLDKPKPKPEPTPVNSNEEESSPAEAVKYSDDGYLLPQETVGNDLQAANIQRITVTPPTLIVRIKRRLKDRKKPFIMSTKMDLTPITDDGAATKMWELSGMTLYSGGGGGGHYTSMARYPDGKWYYQNDYPAPGKIMPWHEFARFDGKTCKNLDVNAVGSFEDFLDGEKFLACDKAAVMRFRAMLNRELYAGFYSPAAVAVPALSAVDDHTSESSGSSHPIGSENASAEANTEGSTDSPHL